MQTTPRKLIPAQAEVHRTAHDQDLIEVPRRARLDRETEARNISQVITVLDNQQAGIDGWGTRNGSFR
jgi:hypothetical protein